MQTVADITIDDLKAIIYEQAKKALSDSKTKKKAKPQKSTDQRIVWDHWLKIFGDKHPRMRNLTQENRSIIGARLKTFKVEDLNLVIDYIPHDDFWMGKNDRNQPYYFIQNIFRNDNRVWSLLSKAENLSEMKRIDSDKSIKLRSRIDNDGISIKDGTADASQKSAYVSLIREYEAHTGKKYSWEEHRFLDER